MTVIIYYYYLCVNGLEVASSNEKLQYIISVASIAAHDGRLSSYFATFDFSCDACDSSSE